MTGRAEMSDPPAWKCRMGAVLGQTAAHSARQGDDQSGLAPIVRRAAVVWG